MKRNLQMILLITAGVAAGACLHECQSPKPPQPPEPQGYTVIDTIPYYDTIPYLLPTPAKETAIGTKIIYLPVPAFRIGNNDSINISSPAVGHLKGPQICNNDVENISPDSVPVEIPITQKEYEGEEYHAWVSGYDPSLDSIFVYPRHERVTIREPLLVHEGERKPKRWGIGVFAGYGITPQGFQPCAGISVNYTLWNF